MIHPMRYLPQITTCLILLTSVIGCTPSQEPIQESSEPEVLILKRKNVQLRKAKEETERENIILKDKVALLTNREEKLTRTIAKQKFELNQLRRQVETLADLPDQRDRYKKQVEQLNTEVIRLEMELRQRGENASRETKPAETGE
jgi:predicted RNase H-like nuclease (RuvC/YqgF family)